MDAVLQRVVELKQSLQELLGKIEQEGQSATWPDYLQQFSVISAQVSTVIFSFWCMPVNIYFSLKQFFSLILLNF